MSIDERQLARQQVQRTPQDAIAWVVLAEAELDAGDAVAGELAARHALTLRPGHPEALARLGRAQSVLGQAEAAAETLMQAARAAPGHPGIAVWLGHALEDVQRVEEAADAFAHAYRVMPDEPMIASYLLAARRRLCDWRDVDALSAQVRDAVRRRQAPVEPFAFLSEDATPAEQLLCARLRADVIANSVRPMPAVDRASRSGEPVRLGFLSNGFGAHPTGLLTVAFFEALASIAGIEAHTFALSPDDDSLIRRRLAAATTLHDVAHRAHGDVAGAIREARIDVLFDLRGWGGGGAPEVLAMRPAPVQVNWLAYPGTSGAPWMDYALADRTVLPAALAPHFSEHVAWLPQAFQPSDTTREPEAAPTRAECGLPEDGVVYCCFNNSYKLNASSMRRMFEVLRAVDGSVLWLLQGPGRADDRLRAAANAAGIDPSRLVFMPKQPQLKYLARLAMADLFLDTLPYNAHTTASDALWAGCPVLTRAGDTFASRVAASLVHTLGLDELIAADDEAFVATAISLGRDADARAAVRDRLHAARRTSPLFDMPRFAASFASVARQMATRWRDGLPPQAIVD
ncbi:UDP-N-acetylglucosamine-peptide N-acetylglucosaminyltransferase [Lysobacter sp. TY2-98]|uniref:O-linked N-acetylglucosamine transferase, SPINDLY family protein n=1 Tax=Lysobacter sp. TY2-98 TaxID=2290922 RepID=UPI000E20A415|nr:tetratricopeptide repeat protein [Lysobacter sp. TY2-98]AXK72568.1 UDP-N-acetylglucosamine-peptide N-acetylglucosaminyltransferase [Lysobacter sp. TY2-98]